ncbi:MAG: hypothetical protein KBD55_03280 [Candidatus Pacebacteria bacterium]|nr:hypothetical protein [Candidatus Paceibacterota bacterium]
MKFYWHRRPNGSSRSSDGGKTWVQVEEYLFRCPFRRGDFTFYPHLHPEDIQEGHEYRLKIDGICDHHTVYIKEFDENLIKRLLGGFCGYPSIELAEESVDQFLREVYGIYR